MMMSFRELITPLLCASALVAASPGPARADEGERIFQDTCGSCHDAKTRPLQAVRLTGEKWKEAIDKMEGLGAEIPSGKKLKALLDYLVRTHGPESPAPAEKS